MTADTGEARTLTVAGETVDYALRRTGRRRTVAILVEPDRRITVLAPAGANAETVERIIRRRLPWIRRQRRELEALPPPATPRQWVNGETHRYLGRQYRLKIVRGPERSVKLSGAFFVVTLPDPKDRDAVRRLMEGWYREHARRAVTERARRLLGSTTWLEITDLPPITIRALSHRWGSTTKAGRITYNIDVVKRPPVLLDYVITHELVHLKIPNHGPAYWRLLGRGDARLGEAAGAAGESGGLSGVPWSVVPSSHEVEHSVQFFPCTMLRPIRLARSSTAS